MKATINISDDLYRRVEAKSAEQGRPVDAVATELFQRWLDEEARAEQRKAETTTPEASNGAVLTRRQLAKQNPVPAWLDSWFRAADEAFKDAPPGPTAREILEEDRSRLDRR
jgi:hypothetical protein